MPCKSSRRSSAINHLALALSLLVLTACSSTPTVRYIPQPEPPKPPAIIKPLTDMRPIPAPPVPGKLSALTPKQQATEAIIMYQGVMQSLGQCLSTRDGLIQWIIRL